MTREEAQISLAKLKRYMSGGGVVDKKANEALDMAIKALEESKRKKGRWIFGHTLGHSWMKCSECLVSQDGQTACFSYCPNCGRRMVKEYD